MHKQKSERREICLLTVVMFCRQWPVSSGGTWTWSCLRTGTFKWSYSYYGSVLPVHGHGQLQTASWWSTGNTENIWWVSTPSIMIHCFFFTKLLTHNGILFLFAEQLFLVKHVNEKNRNYFIQVLQIKTHNPQDYSQLPRLPACTLSLTLENMTGRVALIAPHRSQNLPIPTPNPTSAMEVSTLWHSYGRSCLSSKYE